MDARVKIGSRLNLGKCMMEYLLQYNGKAVFGDVEQNIRLLRVWPTDRHISDCFVEVGVMEIPWSLSIPGSWLDAAWKPKLERYQQFQLQ